MSWLLLFLSVLAALLSPASAFFAEGVFGSSPDLNWACCARRFPDPTNLFRKRPFQKHHNHAWGRHGKGAEATMEDKDCPCPIDGLFDRSNKGKVQELQRCREEKERLRAEKVREVSRCRAEKDGARNDKAQDLSRCRAEKDVLKSEKVREAQRCRTEKDQLRAEKDKQLRAEKDQFQAQRDRLKAQLKDELGASQRLRKRLTEEQAKHGKADSCRTELQAAQAAHRNLQGELKEEKRSRMRMWSRLQSERDSKAALKSNLQQERRTAANYKSELSKERAHQARLGNLLEKAKLKAVKIETGGREGFFRKAAWSFLVVGATSCGLWLLKQLSSLHSELEQKRELLGYFERDLGKVTNEAVEEDLTGELQQDSDSKFAYLTCWEERGEEMVRCVKVQCPGADAGSVTVDVLFNGCTVNIAKLDEADSETWTKHFQFRLSDGLFEFAEDQAKLEDGWLTLVFRPYASHSRVFRFPRPFSFGDGRACSSDLSVAGVAAKPCQGLPEYFNLTSCAGESSEEDEDDGKRALEALSPPSPDGRRDSIQEDPEDGAEEEKEEEEEEEEEDEEEEEEGEEEVKEEDEEEEEEDEEEEAEDLPELLPVQELREPEEESEAAAKPLEQLTGASDEGSAAAALEETDSQAASEGGVEKAVVEPLEPPAGAADEEALLAAAAGDDASAAAAAAAEALVSPATSEGFEKVDTVSSVADDEAPPEDAVASGLRSRSESYEEVLEVATPTVGHDLDDSDYELL